MSEKEKGIPFSFVLLILVCAAIILSFIFTTAMVNMMQINNEDLNMEALHRADSQAIGLFDRIDFNYDIENKTLYLDNIGGGRLQIFAEVDAVKWYSMFGFIPSECVIYDYEPGDHIKMDNYKKMILYGVELNESTEINFWWSADRLEVNYYPENNTFVRSEKSRHFC